MSGFIVDPFRFGSGPPPFDTTNLVGWWKADGTLYQDDAGTTPVTADGQSVGLWNNASGTGQHLIQATAGNKPTYKTGILNGKPVVRFDGGDWLSRSSFAYSQPLMYFLVLSLTNTPVTIIDGFDGSNRNALLHGAPNIAMYAGSSVQPGIVQGTPTGWNIWRATYNGASSNLRRGSDGTAGSGAPGTNALAGIVVGARFNNTEPINGDIAEFIVFNASISTTRQNEVGNYLETKYALTWTDI